MDQNETQSGNFRKKEQTSGALQGRLAAVTGATGILGGELCRLLLQNGADLVLLCRSRQKAEQLCGRLRQEFPAASLQVMELDLEQMDSVRAVAQRLSELPLSLLIHAAGAYHLSRKPGTAGYDPVFQINFVSPYYLTRQLLPTLRCQPDARVVAVGSIAYRFAPINPQDVDFSSRREPRFVYGNAKRFLMFSLGELFQYKKQVSLSLVHPGITPTGITAHYPKALSALIYLPMRLLFTPPRRAVRSLFRGVLEPCGSETWIGPRFFGIWGRPRKQRLTGVSQQERRQIGALAEAIYQSLLS